MATRPQKIQKVTNQPSVSAPSPVLEKGDNNLTKPGQELWQQQRSKWVGSVRAERAPSRPVISPDSTYDTLLLNSRAFPVRIPLAEMVDFLQEAWSEEGLNG